MAAAPLYRCRLLLDRFGHGRRDRLAVRLQHLHENFVFLDHAELVAGALFDRARAFLEILHLGIELGVARLLFFVLLLGGSDLLVQLPHAQPSSLTQPERVLNQQQQRCDTEDDQAHRAAGPPRKSAICTADMDLTSGCRTRCGPDSWRCRPGLPRCAATGCTWPCGPSATASRS